MMQRSLIISLVSIGILFFISSCKGPEPVRLYDISKVNPSEAARISIPVDIDIVSIDGRRVEALSDFMFKSIEELHVAPGEHEITVRYIAFWEYDDKNFEKFKSRKIPLRFNTEAGGLYRLTYPELDNIMEAERFSDNPDIWIEEVGKVPGMVKRKR